MQAAKQAVCLTENTFYYAYCIKYAVYEKHRWIWNGIFQLNTSCTSDISKFIDENKNASISYTNFSHIGIPICHNWFSVIRLV